MSKRFSLRGDWERASRLECLETNGLGGYASSTAAGANTRRYHGSSSLRSIVIARIIGRLPAGPRDGQKR